ncbi:MAG: hypothetical protein AAFR23_10065 [Pseudomonadota bacterium]
MQIATDPPQLIGLGIMAAVALLAVLLILRKQPRAVRFFAIALVAVGLGYLATTQVPTDFMRLVFGERA